jgi:PilZ domain
MNRIVVFPQSIAPEALTRAFPAHEALTVRSKSECANALVTETGIDFLVVQRDVYGPEYQLFLSSLKAHFPFLVIILIAPAGPTPPPDGCQFIDGSADDTDLAGDLEAFSRTPRTPDQRRGVRFDWPLGGRLSVGGSEASCKVRAFSSSGAFLETDAGFPAGSTASLRVEFLNSHMTVTCENIRRQEAETGEPGGYGVRFRDLSSAARELSERIVRDAVIQALLYPEQEQQVPVLTSEELLIPGFDQL